MSDKEVRCCATCANLSEEHPFDQQVWMVCRRDVQGEPTWKNIRDGILDIDINEPIDCHAWEPLVEADVEITNHEFLETFAGKWKE